MSRPDLPLPRQIHPQGAARAPSRRASHGFCARAHSGPGTANGNSPHRETTTARPRTGKPAARYHDPRRSTAGFPRPPPHLAQRRHRPADHRHLCTDPLLRLQPRRRQQRRRQRGRPHQSQRRLRVPHLAARIPQCREHDLRPIARTGAPDPRGSSGIGTLSTANGRVRSCRSCSVSRSPSRARAAVSCSPIGRFASIDSMVALSASARLFRECVKPRTMASMVSNHATTSRHAGSRPAEGGAVIAGRRSTESSRVANRPILQQRWRPLVVC